MNLDDLKDKLDGATLAQLQAHIDDLTGQRDAARQESISGRKALKAEVEALKAAKSKMLGKLGLDDDDDLDALPDAKGQAEAMKQYEAKVKKLEKDLAEQSKTYGELSARHRANLQQIAIGQALRGQEFTDPEIAELLLASRVEWDGDQVYYKTDKGLVPLADGVKLLAEQKPHLLRAAGAPGSGHRPNGGAGGGEINPWSKDHFNLTQQGAIALADPAKAEALRLAAHGK
jgi:hypothetical protein